MPTALLATFGLGLCDVTWAIRQWTGGSNSLICILARIGSNFRAVLLWWFLYIQGYPRQTGDKLHFWPPCLAKFKDWNRGSQSLLGKRPYRGCEIQRRGRRKRWQSRRDGSRSWLCDLCFPFLTPPARLLHFPSDLMIYSLSQRRLALKFGWGEIRCRLLKLLCLIFILLTGSSGMWLEHANVSTTTCII